jgi:mRNA-degrading endonuclease RelE of RelBE toxin-antitoxin system
MKIVYSDRAIEALKDAPLPVQRAFENKLRFLLLSLNHPSLHAKKYHKGEDLWQARVNRDWRFYFNISGDTYIIRDVIPHPK